MAAQKGAQASLATLEAAADAAARVTATAPGFRHFLGTPRPSQRFKVDGIDPLCAPAHLPRVRALMNRLSRRMDAEIQWPSHADASLERWENPRIPSGYTYLLQFVAHDLVHSAIPLSVAGAAWCRHRQRAPHAACNLKRCLEAALWARPSSMRWMLQMTTGAPSCGSGACAGKTRTSRRAARSATSRARRRKTSPE